MANTRTRSPLTNFDKLSPNCNKPRNRRVCRITPHHVAGNLTAMAVLSLPNFQTYSPTSGSSCNYAIGSDGTIGLGVAEANRAWTSSSSVNDHQAVTMEIANNGGAPDWRMSDDAVNAWLDLSVDISKFYGFSKIVYRDKPSTVTSTQVENWLKSWVKVDEMAVTLHNWYAATTCPGPYFTRQLPWLIKEANKRLTSSSYKPVRFNSGGTTEKPADPPTTPKKTLDEVAAEVVAGKWGNGQDRTDRLSNAGYDPKVVQNRVNQLLFTGGATNTPYQIMITAPALNVRVGPSTSEKVVKTLVNDKNVYTIVEENDGWGKLKSGLGWVLLSHTAKK